MNAKHQFKYTYNEGCEDFSPVEVTFDIPGEVTLSQMLYNFQSYLKACGATVYFVETPQTHVPTTFATHSSAFHYQASTLDVAEADAIEDI